MSVFVKLLVSMLICTVVPVVLLLLLLTWMHEKQTKENVADHLKSVAALQRNRVDDVRQHSLENLSLLSSRTQLRLSLKQFLESGDAASQEKMNRILRDAQHAVEKLQQIDVVSKDGSIVASTDDSRIGTSPYSIEFLDESLTRDTANTITRTRKRQPILRSAGPLRLEQESIGIIVADSNLSSLAGAIRDYAGLGETGETLLAVKTASGPKYVFPPRFRDWKVVNEGSQLLQAAMSSDESMLDNVTDYRGREVIGISHRVDGTQWALIVKLDHAEAFYSLKQARNTVLWVGGLAVVLLTGAAYAISRSLGAPLSRLATVSRQIQQGDLKCRSSDDRRSDEIGQLARDFYAMAETLIAANHKLEEEVKARTTELADAVQELNRSNRELEQFASIASHDLQTPIRNVATAVDLLRRQLESVELNEKARRYMQHLEDSSALMQSQIEGLLVLSRVHSRGGDTSAEVDTQAMIVRLVEDLQHAIEQTNANVQISQLPPVHADRVQLRQVFQNLIENALKYQPPGATPEVSVSASQNGTQCEFSVTDNGLGIPSEFREKVFEMFKRLHHQRDYKGTGIGLSLCQKIVERHGGRIWVEAREDGKPGSMFKFTIPTAKENGHE